MTDARRQLNAALRAAQRDVDDLLAIVRRAERFPGLFAAAKACWAEAEERRALLLESIPRVLHVDGLAAAVACRTPGLCLFCEEPLPKQITKPRLICSRHECYLAYCRSYQRDRRAAA